MHVRHLFLFLGTSIALFAAPNVEADAEALKLVRQLQYPQKFAAEMQEFIAHLRNDIPKPALVDAMRDSLALADYQSPMAVAVRTIFSPEELVALNAFWGSKTGKAFCVETRRMEAELKAAPQGTYDIGANSAKYLRSLGEEPRMEIVQFFQSEAGKAFAAKTGRVDAAHRATADKLVKDTIKRFSEPPPAKPAAPPPGAPVPTI